jgi:hypothetical protein
MVEHGSNGGAVSDSQNTRGSGSTVPRLRGRVGWLVATESWRHGCLDLAVLKPPRPDEPVRGLVNPIVLTHSTGRGSKGEALLVYSGLGLLLTAMGGVLLIYMPCCLPCALLLCVFFAVHVQLSVCQLSQPTQQFHFFFATRYLQHVKHDCFAPHLAQPTIAVPCPIRSQSKGSSSSRD